MRADLLGRWLRSLRRVRVRGLWRQAGTGYERHRRLAGLAIVVGAFGVAGATLGATWQASAANGKWQEATRAEDRTSGRTIEMVRYLYEVEAPQAFDLAVITVHAEELERQAAGTERGSAVSRQAAVERRTADALARDIAETSGMAATNRLVADPKYRTADGGFDVRQRLRDLQRQEWDSRDDSAGVAGAGDVLAEQARWWTTAMGLSVLLPIAGMAVWHRSLREETRQPVWPRGWWRVGRWRGIAQARRPSAVPGALRGAPDGAPDVALGTPAPPVVASAGDPPDHLRHIIAGISLILGVLATLFTAGQIRAGLAEAQAFGAAGRHSSQVTATAAGGGVRQAFRDGARYRLALMEARHQQQVDLLVQSSSPFDERAERIAAADAVTIDRLSGIVNTMAAPPRADDGLAPPILTVVSATLADAVAVVQEQNVSVSAADQAGRHSNMMVISLFVVTVAAICLDLAGAVRPRSRPHFIRVALSLVAIAVFVAATQSLA